MNDLGIFTGIQKRHFEYDEEMTIRKTLYNLWVSDKINPNEWLIEFIDNVYLTYTGHWYDSDIREFLDDEIETTTIYVNRRKIVAVR